MRDFLLADMLATWANEAADPKKEAVGAGFWSPSLAEYFAQCSLPTRKSTGWQNVNLKSWLSTRYQLVSGPPAELPPFIVDSPREKYAVVFVDGYLVSALSHLPPGVLVEEGVFGAVDAPITDAWEYFVDALHPSEVFARLALVLARSYTRVTVTSEASQRGVLHLYNYVTKQSPSLVVQNFHGVVAPGGQLDLVQHPVVCVPGSQALVLGNQFLELGEKAIVRQGICQDTPAELGVLMHTVARCAHASNYETGLVGVSRSLTRWFCGIDLVGRGAEASLKGVSLPMQAGQLDIQGVVRHLVARTQSRQHVKAAAADASVSGFCGRVFVAKDAQHVDSSQVNHNLLLGPKARVFSKPELEIYADDVKCAHGSTVGSLDPSQLFYLQSRGLDQLSAKKLLVQGFVRSVFSSDEDENCLSYGHDLVARFLAELT